MTVELKKRTDLERWFGQGNPVPPPKGKVQWVTYFGKEKNSKPSGCKQRGGGLG